jgi:hypothetical protein
MQSASIAAARNPLVSDRGAGLGARRAGRGELQLASIWILVCGLVLYLGVRGGGYDPVLRSQVSEVVWWVAIAGAACGALPIARPGRAAAVAIGLLLAFLVWTAVATTWSISTQDSLGELSRDAGYLGVLALAVALHGDRPRAIAHTIAATATAIVAIACLALASRLHPSLFPVAQETARYLPGINQRLEWPLNYWNALGALAVLGVPLLLSLAGSARRLAAQAAAAAALPLLVLCGYLTFSRGAALAAAVALVAYLALAPERLQKLPTLLVSGAGGAALIAGAVRRHAIERGMTGALAAHQGTTLIPAIVLVCAGVGVAQVGIGLAARHGTLPRMLRVTPRRARLLLACALGATVAAALAAHAPAQLSHLWAEFRNPSGTGLHQNSLARFAVLSSNGRYQFWKSVLQTASGAQLWRGWGPGTFQLVWLPRAPFESYVVNAHSLFFETLSDTGVIGLALLVGFFLAVLVVGVRAVVQSELEHRAQAAGLTAALVAFTISTSFDWFWQIPVLPVVFLLLASAALAPRARQPVRTGSDPGLNGGEGPRPGRRLKTRGGIVLLGLACLVAIAVPLALTEDLRASQAAASAGRSSLALRDARAAVALDGAAAGAQLQLALVLEQRGAYRAAALAAQRATAEEPANWSDWLVRSRIEAEAGKIAPALAAYRRARSLNPRSPLFVALQG